VVLGGCSKTPSQQIGSPSGVWGAPPDLGEAGPGNPYAEVPNAHLTIARHMPEFRRCFEMMDASGKVSLVLIIGREGHVRRAHASGPVPRKVTRCVEETARSAQFSPPEGAQIARLDVPVAIYRQ
jgi:outer membrane biosynthesis protein TonB